MIDLNIIKFCAEEVERQGRGPIQVAWMVEAWLEATVTWRQLTDLYANFVNKDVVMHCLIKRLGHLVEHQNPIDTWRRINVRVGARICPNVAEVPDLMDRWGANLSDMTPEEAYKELMEIHPFADGNGRVGKIVYNALKGTLDSPQMPPNFFNCANP